MCIFLSPYHESVTANTPSMILYNKNSVIQSTVFNQPFLQGIYMIMTVPYLICNIASHTQLCYSKVATHG